MDWGAGVDGFLFKFYKCSLSCYHETAKLPPGRLSSVGKPKETPLALTITITMLTMETPSTTFVTNICV